YPSKTFDGATLVVDSYGKASVSGFESAMHAPQAATIVQALNFHVSPWKLPGTQRLMISYSNRPHIKLEDFDRLLLSGVATPHFDRLGLARTLTLRGRNLTLPGAVLRAAVTRLLDPDETADEWSISYDFDQYFYVSPEDSAQGFGVFGR